MGNRYLNGCMVAVCLTILTTGCSTIKKAGIVGASAGLGATAGSVISGGAIAPIAGSMLGELISMGGWLLILIVVVPMVLGWIIPGPLTTHKKKR